MNCYCRFILVLVQCCNDMKQIFICPNQPPSIGLNDLSAASTRSETDSSALIYIPSTSQSWMLWMKRIIHGVNLASAKVGHFERSRPTLWLFGDNQDPCGLYAELFLCRKRGCVTNGCLCWGEWYRVMPASARLQAQMLYTHTHTHTHTHIYLHKRTLTHKQTHTHTHMNIHTHTHPQGMSSLWAIWSSGGMISLWR